MSGETLMTTDHDTIRRWAEARGARPAFPRGTADEGGGGVLRFDVQGWGAEENELEPVEWDRWFATFDDRDLAMLYQETTADGETSTFFKFVRRDDE